MQTINDTQLVRFGAWMRERREALGLSLRALARTTGVSSSYLASLETAKNPTTGKPAAPSVRVLSALATALNLELTELMQATGLAPAPSDSRTHALLYVLGDRPTNALEHVARLYPGIDRWVYIPDSRESPHDTPDAIVQRTAVRCDWQFGGDPYPDRYLRPAGIVDRLETELQQARDRISADEVIGLTIADCSAVMRWVENPQAEVDFESVWPTEVERVFRTTLGRGLGANVCVYQHADVEAMGLQLDSLSVVVRLLQHHAAVAVLERDGRLLTGYAAAQSALREVKPAGVSTAAWRDLSSAAARSLIGRRELSPPV